MTRPGTMLALASIALALAHPVGAQIGFGGHAARTGDSWGDGGGMGLRLQLGVPLVPIGLALNGEYFFARCSARECPVWGATVDANYSLPLPLLQPWVGVGWSVRRFQEAGADSIERGPNVGFGAKLALTAFQPFIDIRYRLSDLAGPPHVVRIGVMLR